MRTACQARSLTMASAAAAAGAGKKEGDISSVFVSLSGASAAPLPSRYRDLKQSLVRGREIDVVASWRRLLSHLRDENARIAAAGPDIIPMVDFDTNSDVFQSRLAAAAPQHQATGCRRDPWCASAR